MSFSRQGVKAVTRLLSNLTTTPPSWRDQKILTRALAIAMESLRSSSADILDPYYQPFPAERNVLAHGDLLANLLVRVSENLRAHESNLAAAIATLNRALHGIDYFPALQVPRVLKLVHPIGSVISGRAEMGDYIAIYQGVTVGASRLDGSVYPRFSERTVLFSGSSVLGNCSLGNDVVVGANACIIDTDIPDDSVVVGQFPNHRVLSGGRKLLNEFFRGR